MLLIKRKVYEESCFNDGVFNECGIRIGPVKVSYGRCGKA
jgi:hypothetical protein